jgi:hypothetical protein
MKRFLRTAALTFSAMVLCAVFAALIGYHIAINKPGQGGWSLLRAREIAPLLVPFLLFGSSALFVTLKGATHAFSPAALTVFTLSGFYTLILSAVAFTRIPQAGMLFSLIALTAFLVLVSLVTGRKRTGSGPA